MEFNSVKRKKANGSPGSPNCNRKRMYLDMPIISLEETGFPTEVSANEEVTIILQLGEKAKQDKIIYNKATVQELLKSSPFHEKHTGLPRYQFDKHCILINIINKQDIDELLKVNKLTYEQEEWEIMCRLAEKAPGLTFGVLKIHPSVSTEDIRRELIRNNIKVGDVKRIEKREGPTWAVRIVFKDNKRPEWVTYAGEDMRVIKYNPGVLICNRCSKGGHLAKFCNSIKEKCPLCNKDHGKKDCKISGAQRQNPENRECANCGGKHHANFRGCEYYIKEKEIVNTMVALEVPRYKAKQHIRETEQYKE